MLSNLLKNMFPPAATLREQSFLPGISTHSLTLAARIRVFNRLLDTSPFRQVVAADVLSSGAFWAAAIPGPT